MEWVWLTWVPSVCLHLSHSQASPPPLSSQVELGQGQLAPGTLWVAFLHSQTLPGNQWEQAHCKDPALPSRVTDTHPSITLSHAEWEGYVVVSTLGLQIHPAGRIGTA